MGSKSKSSSSNKSTAFTFNNVDYGEGSGGGGLKNLNLAASESSIGNVTITDGGATRAAIEAMTQAAMSNNDLQKQFIQGVTDNTGALIEGSGKFVDGATKLAKDNQDFLDGIATTTLENYQQLNSSLIAFTQSQNQQAANAADKALDYVYQANQDDATRLTENLSKWMIAVPAGLVALFLFYLMIKERK